MRLAYWKRDPRMAYGQVFKNVGQAAGASLEHAHSQLLVIPRVPNVIAAEMSGSLDYFRRRGCCPFCDMIREELAGGQRIVEETAHHLSFAPYAARLPFETWILPKVMPAITRKRPRSSLQDLAGIVRSVIRRLEAAVGRCAYNYVLHTTPFAQPRPGALSLAYRNRARHGQDGGVRTWHGLVHQPDRSGGFRQQGSGRRERRDQSTRHRRKAR